MAFLEARDLRKSYGELEAVSGVSFSIDPGELFSLLGPNGAGKSTTINMLSGLVAPSGGEATMGGVPLSSGGRAYKAEFGLVPQDLALYEELTGLENLLFWGRMHGLRGRALRARAGEALERVGLVEASRRAVRTYSGGMKRRINFAAAVLHAPRFLFLDAAAPSSTSSSG
jgi:ABC-2 type transport system ATP-binding protein